MPRIVSLLPAGTEIACALGARAELVGRSHECDYPVGVERLPVVSTPSLDLTGLSQAQIDAAVSSHMKAGESLYVVDEALLRDLAPDVILTQNLCQVCAPSGTELTRALTTLPTRPQIVYLTPQTLAEIDENILTVGDAIGRASDARALVGDIQARLARLRRARQAVARRPRVTFLEWIDPFFCAGHWVPEMIDIAGGDDPLGRPGRDSVRVSWDEVRACNPEIVVVAPCGFGLADAARLAAELPPIPNARVCPVDANAYFARPGPRYVDGIEVLAEIFQSVSRSFAASSTYPISRDSARAS
ncbi:MAG TPA: ABC transporter substrate-binding protein [Gemmatimonadaceae bacterium]|jgi:iron complex transport system substrate-binding protein|nr:ABC transporter substrate-binding protein [Gemmatimonadaceae bacterium]